MKIIWLKGHKVLTTLESIFFSSKSSAVLFRLHLIKHTKMSYWVGYMRTFWSDLFKGSSSISIYLGWARGTTNKTFLQTFLHFCCALGTAGLWNWLKNKSRLRQASPEFAMLSQARGADNQVNSLLLKLLQVEFWSHKDKFYEIHLLFVELNASIYLINPFKPWKLAHQVDI